VTIEDIQRLVAAGRCEVSIHAQQERLDDDLDIADIEQALVAEQYYDGTVEFKKQALPLP